jgi:dihydrofolate synthase / folylpolyglutamate synthase
MNSEERDAGYRSALKTIWDRSDYDRGVISNPFSVLGQELDAGLVRTAALLDRLGNPHDRLTILHVAGSKGKGSTCAFLASICHAAGFRTGLFTSPHLHTIRERFTIDSAMVTEEQFATYLPSTMEAVDWLEAERPELGQVTSFELLTAMGLQIFATEGCNVAVIEVGLGGTHDATNVVNPIVSVITTLDYEHTKILGESIAEIAENKAGIIKPGKPVVSASQVADAIEVIERVAKTRGSHLLLAGRDWHVSGDERSCSFTMPWGGLSDCRLGLAGAHQVDNAGLAVAAAGLLAITGWPISDEAMRTGLASARLPGRFESVEHQSVSIILDGAHTPAAAQALVQSLDQRRIDRIELVVGMLQDKQPDRLLASFRSLTDRVLCASPISPRAMDAGTIAKLAASAGFSATRCDSVSQALQTAISRARADGRTVVVTGSLTTVAEGREALGLAVHDPNLAP